MSSGHTQWRAVRRLTVVMRLLGVAFALTAVAAARADACPAGVTLVNCRVYEQVSPVEKQGFDAPSVRVMEFPVEATADGNSFAYMSLGSFAGPQAGLLPSAYISSRKDNGWETTNVTPPTLTNMPFATTEEGYGYDFSPDLSEIVFKLPFQALSPPSESAPPGVYNLFLQNHGKSYSLVTASPPVAPPGECETCFEEQDLPAFMGGNSGTATAPAFSHILFEENESLLTTPAVGSEPGVENLYESNMNAPPGERVHPVGILPDGAIATAGSVVGSGVSARYSATWIDTQNNGLRAEHAISADGSHVIFQAAADGGPPDSTQAGLTQVYDRINASSTVELSVRAAGATPANTNPGSAQFWAASVDGSKVFFTSSAELTTQSNTGAENEGNALYLYDFKTHTLTDVAPDVSDPSGSGVLGVLGASGDGAYVYFVATGQLVAGKGVSGDPNLYVYHTGAPPVFIATLNARDGNDWTAISTRLTSYVAPDGRNIAFTSFSPLTGYDNRDQNQPGTLDSEVYKYSVGSDRVVCASCEASGAQPIGNSFIGFSRFNRLSSPFYHPRILSDDGAQLYYSTSNPKVPETSNLFGSSNLFDYEGDRSVLIARNAYFLDASASGNDLFLATRGQLSPEDHDEYVDVYDARVDGRIAQVSPVPCAENGCRQPYGGPSTLTTSGSATFRGPGNAEPPTKPAPPRRPTDKQRLTQALKRCAKLKGSRRRAQCVSEAKRRYGHGKKTNHTGVRGSARPSRARAGGQR